MAKTIGWTRGALISVLEGIVANSTQPDPPPEQNVVTLQVDVKKLVEAIRIARKDLEAAQRKRADLAVAWTEFDHEMIQDEEATAQRLFNLQVQFSKVAADCGLEVLLPPGQSQMEAE